MARRPFHNPPPPPTSPPAGAPLDAVKADFAMRVQRALNNKGWNQSELARRAQDLMAGKGRFGRDSINGYVRGKTLPTPLHLEAMAKALGVPPEELLPRRAVASAGNQIPAADMRDMGDGNVWLRVNRAVPYALGVQIMSLLLGPAGSGSGDIPPETTPAKGRRRQQMSEDEQTSTSH